MNDQRNTLYEIAFIFILSSGTLFAFWWVFHGYILFASFYASFYLFKVYEYLPFLMTSTEYQHIVAARKAIATIKPGEYGLRALYTLFEYHGYVWRAAVIPFMLWWGWSTGRSVVRFKFKRDISDVYALIEIQAKHFPASAIIRGKNLLARHPYQGPWATYALPLDFALDNQLLWVSKAKVAAKHQIDETKMFPIPALTLEQKVKPFPVKRKMLPNYAYVSFHVARANLAFSRHLGSIWKGPEALPPLERALFAAFCTQAAGKQKEAWKMIEQLAFSFKEGERDKAGKLISHHAANTQGTQDLLDKYYGTPSVQAAVNLHAHTVNVITAVLKVARSKGRLMHSNFLWMKPVNRTLWYSLCGQGGQSAYWEAAGAWAHGQVEEMMGSKIVVPMVAGAVEALRDTMSREHWIDPGEYSEEAQTQIVKDANDKLTAEIAKNKAGKPGNGAGSLYEMGKSPPQPKSPVKHVENEDD